MHLLVTIAITAAAGAVVAVVSGKRMKEPEPIRIPVKSRKA